MMKNTDHTNQRGCWRNESNNSSKFGVADPACRLLHEAVEWGGIGFCTIPRRELQVQTQINPLTPRP